MISGYHQGVADHYEKFPYPVYPWYAMGSWAALQSVDVSEWGIDRLAHDIWVAGCGTIAAFMFGRRNPNCRILGSDLSQKSLKICDRRLQIFGIHNVQLVCEDLMEVRYENQFDAVDCYGVLHHTVSPQKVLEKLARSLRSGGVLRLMVYSKQGRAEIERLRSDIISSGLKTIPEIRKFLRDRHIEAKGDLRSIEGIADAFLNPIVHTYGQTDLERLIASVESLELMRIDDRSNLVAFLKKKN